VSDRRGRFEFDGLPAVGSYRLVASRAGLAPGEAGPYRVEAGTDRDDVECRLERTARLTLRLADPEGHPVSGGLEVRLRKATSGPRSRFAAVGEPVPAAAVKPAADGRYNVEELRPGSFDCVLLPEHWRDLERRDLTLRPGETTDLGTLTVAPAASIAGSVADPGQVPIADANVTAIYGVASGGFLTRETTTGADGRYVLEGLGEETVVVRVTAAGYAEALRRDVPTGERAVDFVLAPTGSVIGRVALEDGAAPGPFTVRAHVEGRESMRADRALAAWTGQDGGRRQFTSPGGDGSFRLEGLEPGTYTLEVRGQGKAPAKKPGVSVTPGGTADVGTIELADGLALAGRVVLARDGSAVAGAAIRATGP
ncbi:MAG TPA: carboxypeptidase-like regulatory domain-containing protein, partial [Candidatus Polarisedimenticolaceae bacterium]|nr:carboxypeptidase-like regulatory domain-containing protein [Candidatus Polarisedimenticolaceae bacterium]